MNHTKMAIVKAFGDLLMERPLNKITVKDIVARCGVNRNTFYYHFADIPTLLEETVKDRADSIIAAHSQFGSPLACLTPIVQYSTQYKKAVLHIYRSVQRDIFLTYLDHMALHIVRQYIDTVAADLFPSPTQEKELLIRYYKCAMVGVVLDWLDAGMEYDLLAAAVSVCKLLDGSSRNAFLRCAGNS